MKNEKQLRILVRSVLNENINQQLNEEPSGRDQVRYHVNAGDEKHDVVSNFMIDYVQDWIGKNNIDSPWHPTDINVKYDKATKYAIYYFYFFVEDESLNTNTNQGHEYRLTFNIPYSILSSLDSGAINKEKAYSDIKDSAKIEFEYLTPTTNI